MEVPVKLINKKEEARETKTFFFEKPGGFSYIAGQYCYFTLTKLSYEDSRGGVRHFTLSSSPTEENIALTTRMRTESGFKKTLDELPEGSQVVMSGPQGDFILGAETATTPQVMIAGGIGVTPYRSIIRYVADKNLQVPIHLIYANSLPEDIAFKEEFEEIVSEHKNIKISYTVSRPEESNQPWTGLTGRIDENMLSQLTTHYSLLTTHYWLCGPPAMVSAMEEVLDKLQVPQDRVKVEKFTGYN